MDLWAKYLLVGVVSYLLGSIPFTLLAGKLFFGIDPREHGSGNLGSTNALRVLGKRAAIGVLALDLGKGALAVAIARMLFPAGELVGADLFMGTTLSWAMMLALIGAVAGHAFPVYIGFKGGKGVATAGGGLLVLMPLTAVILLAIFFSTVALSRYVSAGSVTAAAMFPVMVLLLNRELPLIVFSLLMAGGVIYLHRANIRRLRAGTESKLSFQRDVESR